MTSRLTDKQALRESGHVTRASLAGMIYSKSSCPTAISPEGIWVAAGRVGGTSSSTSANNGKRVAPKGVGAGLRGWRRSCNGLRRQRASQDFVQARFLGVFVADMGAVPGDTLGREPNRPEGRGI